MQAKAEQVQAHLKSLGVDATVIEVPQSTRTAAEAAAAIGTTVAQIVKSLIFAVGAEPILALASGTNRVDPAKLAARLGGAVRQLDGKSIKEITGYAIGGVPPVGHRQALRTFIDADLFQYLEIWAAAGTPHAVFSTTPGELARITGGETLDLAVR
jgi:prolyl-tRNA editing enzyme YbaK/EbsC (Cys-tRNA(Pro) deacylase)